VAEGHGHPLVPVKPSASGCTYNFMFQAAALKSGSGAAAPALLLQECSPDAAGDGKQQICTFVAYAALLVLLVLLQLQGGGGGAWSQHLGSPRICHSDAAALASSNTNKINARSLSLSLSLSAPPPTNPSPAFTKENKRKETKEAKDLV